MIPETIDIASAIDDILDEEDRLVRQRRHDAMGKAAHRMGELIDQRRELEEQEREAGKIRNHAILRTHELRKKTSGLTPAEQDELERLGGVAAQNHRQHRQAIDSAKQEIVNLRTAFPKVYEVVAASKGVEL